MQRKQMVANRRKAEKNIAPRLAPELAVRVAVSTDPEGYQVAEGVIRNTGVRAPFPAIPRMTGGVVSGRVTRY